MYREPIDYKIKIACVASYMVGISQREVALLYNVSQKSVSTWYNDILIRHDAYKLLKRAKKEAYACRN